MKKRVRNKDTFEAPQQPEQDATGLIIKMQQQLEFLEKKIDALISQVSSKPYEEKHHQKPYRHFDRSHHQGGERQGGDFRARMLHKAVCAECGQQCEVPFRPSGERPVYCKECFSQRKTGGSVGPREAFTQRERSYMPRHGEGRRHAEKKRFPPRKRKE